MGRTEAARGDLGIIGQVTNRSRTTAAAALVVIACLFAVYWAALRDNGAKGAGVAEQCISDMRQRIDSGDGPSDRPWRVMSSIRNNNGCESWVVGMEFYPAGSQAGSWRGAWGIPSGGHLSDSFTIAAHDEAQLVDRSVSGVTGARVRTLVFSTSSGRKIVQHPRLPSKALRSRHVWLHNLRYFLAFYPAGSHCTSVKLLDAHGGLLASIRGFEGSFEGPTGSGL